MTKARRKTDLERGLLVETGEADARTAMATLDGVWALAICEAHECDKSTQKDGSGAGFVG